MVRLVGVLFAIAAIALAGCRSTPRSTPTPEVTPTPRTGDSVGEAYRLIIQRSVGQVDPSAVANAGVQGLRLALITDGVVPPNVPAPSFTADPNQDVTQLHAAVQTVSTQYASKLSQAQAEDAVITSMASSVDDCHTTYFPPAAYAQQQEWIRGQTQFGGIGASLRRPKLTEPLIIWRVFSGTPADRAGLKDGDIIQAADGRDISTLSVQAVVDLIRGPVGQPVHLTIQSGGGANGRVITIVRAQIQPPSVEYRMLPNKVGYVQLYGFPENVATQVKAALDALDRQGAKAWIVDIRDNGGGSLDSVTQVTSMFVPKGRLLYYLYDANGQRTDYVADGSIRSRIPRVTVLTNDGSGSGAEIFAAVLREQGVATIVGEKTAGCVGTGQLYSLPDGGGIQVTVAQLITGRGAVLNRIGVQPDTTVPMTVQDLTAGRDPQLQQALQSVQPAG
jgi:carboxyl-terminal processing protease